MELILLPNFYGINSLSDKNKDACRIFKERLIYEVYVVYKKEEDYVLFKLINKALQYDPPKLENKKTILNINGVDIEVFEVDKSNNVRTLWSFLEYYKIFYRTNSKRTRKLTLDKCYQLESIWSI